MRSRGSTSVAEPQPTLTSRTFTGVRWTYLGTAAQFGLQLLYQVVINRLLDPVAFGLMAIGLLGVRFGHYFTDMGVGQALIQKADLDEEDIRTAFTLSILFASFCYAVVWVAAPFIATFFDQRDATAILRVVSVALLFAGLGITSQSLLRRELRFAELMARRTTAYVVGYLVVGVGLAIAGAGVWSLVAAQLTGMGLGTLFAYSCARHSLRPAVSWDRVRNLYSFGARVSVVSLMEYVGSNLDTLAVGRFATTAMLGQYSRAYFLTSYPTQQLTSNFSQVLFPILSRIQTDTARIRRVYLSAVRLAAFLLLPVCVGLAVSSRELVLVVLGGQWGTAITILPIMAVAVAFHVMSHFAGVVATARADLNKKMALQATYLIVLAAFLLIAYGHGLWAYAAALAAGEAVRNIGYALMMQATVGASLWETWRAYWPGLFAASVVAILVGVTRVAMIGLGAPLVGVLVSEVLAAAAALFATLRYGPVDSVRREIRQRLVAAGGNRGGSTSRLARAVLRSH